MSSSALNIRIEPANATWDIEEQWQVTAIADVSSALNNKYFNIYAGDGISTEYYVWFNVGAAGADPTPGGTGLEVAFAA